MSLNSSQIMSVYNDLNNRVLRTIAVRVKEFLLYFIANQRLLSSVIKHLVGFTVGRQRMRVDVMFYH